MHTQLHYEPDLPSSLPCVMHIYNLSHRAWGSAIGAGVAAFLFGKVWGSDKRVKQFKEKCDSDLLDAFDKAKENLEKIIDEYETEATLYQDLIKQGKTTIKKLEDILYHLPDVNNDDLIDRKEFDDYMVKFKKMHPNVADEDLPHFEDMDQNHDGTITFKGIAGSESMQQLYITCTYLVILTLLPHFPKTAWHLQEWEDYQRQFLRGLDAAA